MSVTSYSKFCGITITDSAASNTPASGPSPHNQPIRLAEIYIAEAQRLLLTQSTQARSRPINRDLLARCANRLDYEAEQGKGA